MSSFSLRALRMFRQGRIEQASAEAPLARTVPSIVGEKMRQRIPIEQVVFIMGCLSLLAFVLVRVLRKLLQNRAGARPFANLGERKLSNIYLRSIRKGLRPRDLVRVYSQMDMSLILSILSFARIPSDVLFPRMNNLRTGVAIEGYNDSIVRVLYPDYPRAKDPCPRLHSQEKEKRRDTHGHEVPQSCRVFRGWDFRESQIAHSRDIRAHCRTAPAEPRTFREDPSVGSSAAEDWPASKMIQSSHASP